jgi:ribose 5-phosphate isomerase
MPVKKYVPKEAAVVGLGTGACVVKNMLAIYLKYHKAGLTPTTSVTSTAISSVKMAIGHKSLTNLRSEMIFLQGKPVFYIFLPSTPPY